MTGRHGWDACDVGLKALGIPDAEVVSTNIGTGHYDVRYRVWSPSVGVLSRYFETGLEAVDDALAGDPAPVGDDGPPTLGAMTGWGGS